jgi:hypothetical protein
MELGSLLLYKGLRVEQVTDSAPAGTQGVVRLHAPHAFADGRCQSWRRIRCHETHQPASDALIVLLPEDFVPDSAIATYQQRFTTVRSVVFPSARWLPLRGVLEPFLGITPSLRRRNLPSSHWLRLDVYHGS